MTFWANGAKYLIALLGLFFMSGTLTSYLTPSGSETAPMVQVFGAAIGLFSCVALLFHRDAIPRIIGSYWLALIPVLFAVASLAWTADFALSLRRAGSLCLTTAFAFWLVFNFSAKELFKVVIFASISIIIVNFLVIQVDPIRGIHQVFDEDKSSRHAGSWRGLFGHKNDFGRLVALSTSFLVLGFAFSVGGRMGRWLLVPVLGIAVLLVMKSNSSQAVLLIGTVPMAVILLLFMRNFSPSARSLIILVALPVAIFAALSAQLLFEYVLHLLGRDPTLTGRTIIWEGVILGMGNNSLLGGGYGAGWEVVGPRVTALTGAELGHAHNGFLDLAVDIGWLGLGMTVFFMVWLGVVAFGNLMRGIHPEISAMALTVVLFALIGNVAGSFFLKHNSLYWILPVVCFAKLYDARTSHSRGRQGSQAYAPLRV